MEGTKVVFEVGNTGLVISESVFLSLIVLAIITSICIYLTRNLQKIPVAKSQIVAEMLVNSVNNLIKQSMGNSYVKGYGPYIATIIAYSFVGSSLSLFGLKPLTVDINIILGWALITFGLMQVNRYKSFGFIGYFKNLANPLPFMLPLNVMSELIIPVSMSFRHFGNILGGLVISDLILKGLNSLNSAIGIPFPLIQIGIPAVLSVYLDIFMGALQAYIFATLTMVFVSTRGKQKA